jgi:hypothetical protein
MSQEVISQKIRKTCEGCGSITEFEMINTPDETLTTLQNWYTVIRELLVMTPQGPQYQKAMVQACSPTCVSAATLKLVSIPIQIPPPAGSENEPEIDLASLRMSDPPVN